MGDDDGREPSNRELAEALRAVVDEIDELRAENRALRQRVDDALPARPAGGAEAAPSDGATPRFDRRRLLRDGLVAGAAGAAAAGVSGLAGATPVAAATGDAVKAGQVTTTPDRTTIESTGDSRTDPAFLVTDDLARGPAGAHGFSGAVMGASYYRFSAGVLGYGVDQICELGTGVMGVGQRAIVAESSIAHITMRSNGSKLPPPADGHGHGSGELTSDLAGDLWWCSSDGVGDRGRWRTLSGPGAAGAFHLFPTPRRVYDSRPGTLPIYGVKAPLEAGNVARTVDLRPASEVPGDNDDGAKVGASGVVLTVMLVEAVPAAGNFTVWANGVPKPAANSLVWGGSSGRFSTLAVSAVDGRARIQVAASHRTNVVIDVLGYYR